MLVYLWMTTLTGFGWIVRDEFICAVSLPCHSFLVYFERVLLKTSACSRTCNELKVNPFELKLECSSWKVYFNVGKLFFFPLISIKCLSQRSKMSLDFYKSPSIKPYEL